MLAMPRWKQASNLFGKKIPFWTAHDECDLVVGSIGYLEDELWVAKYLPSSGGVDVIGKFEEKRDAVNAVEAAFNEDKQSWIMRKE